MKNKLLFSLLVCLISLQMSFAQNLEVVATVTIEESGNDVWGYIDPNSGLEYAVYGTRNSTRIYSLEDASAPNERAIIMGASSTWRDIKQVGQYLYVVADQGQDGLLIINMTEAPETITHEFYELEVVIGGIPDTMRTCHNIYADETGYLYLSGCNPGNGGVIIADVNQDPQNPVTVGVEDFAYAHDAFTRDDLLFASEISPGGNMAIYDVSDKSNPFPVGQAQTSSAFTHNIWSDDNNDYAFTTDERGNGYVDAYDIRDLDDIKRLDQFQPITTQGRGVIPHNTHYLDGMLYTSWYTDGIIVTDVNRPANMIQVGQYDTWDGADGGFDGCWGAYPFFPSGLILASNISTTTGSGALFILQPDVKRACYLEGTVTELGSGTPINMVAIKINSEDPNGENSNVDGAYAFGQATAGSFEVSYSHPEYKTKTIMVDLANGEVTEMNVELEGKEQYSVELNAVDALNMNGLPEVKFSLVNDQFSFELDGDANGQAIAQVFEGNYELIAGRWGYKYASLGSVEVLGSTNLTVELDRGIVDDFVFDYGWTTAGTAPRGRWVRDIPKGTTFSGNFSNPNVDVEGDFGNKCFVTGNIDDSVGLDDVDQGEVILTSPMLDLSEMNDPEITYSLWFFDGGGSGGPSNDSLTVSLTNGTDTLIVETLTDREKNSGFWRPESLVKVNDFFTNASQIWLIVSTADDFNDGHLVEAGFDKFAVNNGPLAVSEALYNDEFKVSPNPFNHYIEVVLSDVINENLTNSTAYIYDINGKLMQTFQNLDLSTRKAKLDINYLATGNYILSILNDKTVLAQKKIIKVD